jgi:cyclopropane-fatty-acyl-phospholipid synthase
VSLLQSNAQDALRETYQSTLEATGLIERYTRRFAEVLGARQLCVRISLNGTSVALGQIDCLASDTPEFVFPSERTLRALFQKNRLLHFARAYVDGEMRINGSLEKAVEILDVLNMTTDQPRSLVERCQTIWFHLNKAIFSRAALQFESSEHYGNDARAYELFLDPRMQYTCGRFLDENADIEEAQLAKFALINELATKHGGPLAGKDHLDIGCGWGGMVSYFEETFKTRSVGNTNSLPQLDYAKRRYGSEILLGDFSKLQNSGRKFDLITIIGMIEHLTPSRRSHLLRIARNVLKDDGLVFIQCITKPKNWIGGDAYRFVQQEVFPGHYLETPLQTDRCFTTSSFAIIEHFDHGYDYGLTTARWVQNIQKNRAALTKLVGARQYRIYLGYLLFASRMFSTGRGSLMRYLLRKA